MPIQIELIRENRVVLQTYSEPLNSSEINNLKVKMESVILASAIGKLHIIADFRGIQNLPGTILSSGSNMLRKAHSNTGQIVFITSSAFVGAMARILVKLSPKQQLIVVQTLDEAYKEIDALLAKAS